MGLSQRVGIDGKVRERIKASFNSQTKTEYRNIKIYNNKYTVATAITHQKRFQLITLCDCIAIFTRTTIMCWSFHCVECEWPTNVIEIVHDLYCMLWYRILWRRNKRPSIRCCHSWYRRNWEWWVKATVHTQRKFFIYISFSFETMCKYFDR